MSTVTIPKKMTKDGDLVVIPRKEYEALLGIRKLREFRLTSVQRTALKRAEANLRRGKALSYHELARKLGFAR